MIFEQIYGSTAAQPYKPWSLQILVLLLEAQAATQEIMTTATVQGQRVSKLTCFYLTAIICSLI